MTKQSGLGDQLYIDGVNVSGDIGSIGKINGGPKALDYTGIDKSGFERIGGVRDGGIDFSAWFNPSAGQEHATLKTLPTADRIVTYFRGSTLGGACASEIAKQINYDAKRAADGSFSFDVNSLSNGFGVDWGYQLTPGIRSDTTATNGTGIDMSYDALVSWSFGWQAYLQVFSFTGTSVTIQLQDSADNVTFANLGSGGAFTAVTAVGAQRLQSPGSTDTVRRYARVVTSGTFSQVSFVVQFTRNISAVAF
jgi:hypothetical protein